MNSVLKCGQCDNEVERRWKYCRFCGNKLDHEPPKVESESIEKEEDYEEIEEIEFDKDLYYDVLSTRAERSLILKKKKQLKDEIKSLLEQIKAGLVEREYATPKISELKNEVAKITEEENNFAELPKELPIEILNDQIDAARRRLKKIDKLKSDDNVSKDTIVEAKRRSEESLIMLKEQQSQVFGHLRTWKDKLKKKIEEDRKEIEHLYVKFKTEEITQESYNERKTKLLEKIQNDEEVLHNINQILN